MDISVLWDTLSNLQKIYWIIALPSTVIFLLQMVMMLLGGDSEIDGDGDFDGDHGSGMNIFSVKSVVSFLMFFGWTGLAAYQKGILGWGAIGLSFGAGLIMMFVTAWIFFLLLKLQHNNITNMKDAIGKTGEVFLRIPSKKTGNGKIEIMLNGGLRSIDAVTEDAEDIITGSFIEVTGIINDIYIVKRKR